jgi:hypothetical protein
MESQMDLNHLRREIRTALELSVVALAPSELIDRLAIAAGLLEALIELPANSPPVIALVPQLVVRAQRTLSNWQRWQAEHQDNKFPRC